MNRATILNSTVGEYRVMDFVGAGGMGEVYRAVHTRIGHVVALKVLTAASRDSVSGQRFAWEAQVQAQLNHPNIVAFHGLTECQGCACIVMEYVDGQTLSERIRFHGPLSAREALTIFQSIGEAVAHIHSQGIIHRDIKSNNVKINSAGRVKLLDFGIASSTTAPRLTMTGFVVGALESLSPEQLRGQRADERSDIWALGVLLYEMVTGRTPFDAGELTSRGSYPPPTALNPAVPREIEMIIARCLKKDPAERYQSAAALLADVRRALAALSTPRPAHVSMHQPDWAEQGGLSRKAARPLLIALLIGLAFYYLSSPSTPSGPTRPVAIRTTEGAAEVWRNGEYIGDTPLRFEAPLGARLKIKLARTGYRERQFTITVSEGANEYDYTLEKIDTARR